MTDVYEIMSYLPSNRKANLFSSPACKMSEGRHIENLAYCAVGSLKLNTHYSFIKGEDSILPVARALVLTKPSLLINWEGEETSIVLQSGKRPELEGMIVDKKGLPLRPMYANAAWPSVVKYPPSNEAEGMAVSKVVGELGFDRFGLDQDIMYLFPLLFAKLGIEAGDHFYPNIKSFTDYWVERWKNPWES